MTNNKPNTLLQETLFALYLFPLVIIVQSTTETLFTCLILSSIYIACGVWFVRYRKENTPEKIRNRVIIHNLSVPERAKLILIFRDMIKDPMNYDEMNSRLLNFRILHPEVCTQNRTKEDRDSAKIWSEYTLMPCYTDMGMMHLEHCRLYKNGLVNTLYDTYLYKIPPELKNFSNYGPFEGIQNHYAANSQIATMQTIISDCLLPQTYTPEEAIEYLEQHRREEEEFLKPIDFFEHPELLEHLKPYAKIIPNNSAMADAIQTIESFDDIEEDKFRTIKILGIRVFLKQIGELTEEQMEQQSTGLFTISKQFGKELVNRYLNIIRIDNNIRF